MATAYNLARALTLLIFCAESTERCAAIPGKSSDPSAVCSWRWLVTCRQRQFRGVTGYWGRRATDQRLVTKLFKHGAAWLVQVFFEQVFDEVCFSSKSFNSMKWFSLCGVLCRPCMLHTECVVFVSTSWSRYFLCVVFFEVCIACYTL